MSGKDVTTELPVEIGDPLAAKIRDSILGVDRGAVLGQFLPRRGTLPIAGSLLAHPRFQYSRN